MSRAEKDDAIEDDKKREQAGHKTAAHSGGVWQKSVTMISRNPVAARPYNSLLPPVVVQRSEGIANTELTAETVHHAGQGAQGRWEAVTQQTLQRRGDLVAIHGQNATVWYAQLTENAMKTTQHFPPNLTMGGRRKRPETKFPNIIVRSVQCAVCLVVTGA